MSIETGERTKGLILFAYVLAFLAPITGPLFAIALYREGDDRNAAGVIVVAVVWTAIFVHFIL